MRWGGSGRLFEFDWGELGWSGRLFEVERLLPFFVFRMDAYWRLGTYSNKYGKNLSRFSPVISESNPFTS